MADELERLKDLGREIAEPSGSSEGRARRLLQRRIDVASGRRARFWRPLHVRWALAGVVAVLLASGFGFGLGAWNTEEGSAKTSLVGLGFLPARGWTVVQSTAVGQRDAASAVAANVPLRASADLRATARATGASLPGKGILIFATFAIRGDPASDAGFDLHDLPLSLRHASVASQSSDRRVYRIRAGVGGYNVDAQIHFGAATPSAETIEVAQRQLNRLVVASEPVTILARPTVLGRGQKLTLYGSVDSEKAEEIVTIEAKDCGQTSFREVAAARTQEGGGWSYDLFDPNISASVRAAWNNQRSSPVAVQDRPYVSLRRLGGSSSRFSVVVGAKLQFWRKYVVIERFEQRLGSWKPSRKVVLTDTSSTAGSSFVNTFQKFRLSVPKSSLLRAFFPRSQAGPCYLAGYSQLVRT